MQIRSRLPNFQPDDLDWALGELIQVAIEAKRAGKRLTEFNPGVKRRCMNVIGCCPPEVRFDCYEIVRLALERTECPEPK
jgi:hypothetical protein